MKRRAVLKLGAIAAIGAVSAPYVHAQSKKFAGITLRVNGYGGLYDKAFEKMAAPLEEKYGLKVQITAGMSTTDLVKMLANRENPPFDLYNADSSTMSELIKAGVLEQIDPSAVSNLNRVLPNFREFGGYGAPYSVSSVVPIYNSKYIKKPLSSYSDIARPDLAARVILPAPSQLSASLYLLAIAEENGGSIANMESAFKILAAAKPNVVALAQTNVAQMQMFQNEEGYAGIFYDGRAHELRTKGVPIVTVIPQLGIYSTTSYINIVKGMKYPEAAYAYIQQQLSDEGMLAIPDALRYGVTTDVKLPEELREQMLLNSPERNALKRKIDWDKLWADRGAWIEQTNKIMRS